MENGVVINNTHYLDTGCEFSESCLECPFEECEYEVLYKTKVVQRDMKILSGFARRLKRGGYDINDGKLPYPEAMTRVLLRAKRLNEEKGYPTDHIEAWIEKLGVG